MKKIYWTSVAILILFGMQGAELKSHEKTTAGSLIVDHEVTRENFSFS